MQQATSTFRCSLPSKFTSKPVAPPLGVERRRAVKFSDFFHKHTLSEAKQAMSLLSLGGGASQGGDK